MVREARVDLPGRQTTTGFYEPITPRSSFGHSPAATPIGKIIEWKSGSQGLTMTLEIGSKMAGILSRQAFKEGPFSSFIIRISTPPISCPDLIELRFARVE